MTARIWRNIWCLSQRGIYVSKGVIGVIPNTSTALQLRSNATIPEVKKFNSNFTRKTIPTTIVNVHDCLEKLKSEQATTGRVRYDLFLKTVQNLSDTLPEEHSIFLLECCAKNLPSQTCQERLELFNQIWDFLKLNNMICENHYLAALSVFSANKTSISNFRKFIDDSKMKDNIQIYEQMVWLFCSNGNIEQAKEVLNEMKNKKFPLTANSFNALILGHSRSKTIQGIKEVLETMSAARIEPSSETYTQLARAYIESSEVEKFSEILTKQGQSFDTNQIYKILKSAALIGLKPAINQLVKLLPADILSMKEIPPAIRTICTELVFSGLPENAFAIIEAFPKPIFSENQDRDTFGVSFIYDLIKSNQPPEKVIEFCESLISSEKNTRALHVACDFALRRNSKDCLRYLEKLALMEPLRPHYFWPLLLNNFRNSGEAGLLRILKAMSKLNTECDFDTLSTYVFPRLSIILEDEKKAIQTLEDCGLKTSQFLTPLISHLILQQRVDPVISICELYQTKLELEKLVYPLINLVVNMRAIRKSKKLPKLISSLNSKLQNPGFDFVGQLLMDMASNPKLSNDLDFWKNLILNLKEERLNISPVASDVVLSHLSRFEKDNDIMILKRQINEMVNKNINALPGEFTETHIRHPRDMNLDELECHLIELESKGLNTRGVLRRILQLSVREGKLERALEVKKKCDELKVQISPGMMASVFDMFIKLKRLDDAKDCYHFIKKTFPGFLLDEHKIIDFAALLVEKNRYDEAKDILVKRASTTKIVGGDYINKNLWNLLTKSATAGANLSKTTNQTKELFVKLQELRYCRPQNIFLGPIIREHLLRNDIKGAVAEYQQFTEMYKKTPLQFELMSQLVSLSNDEGTNIFQISSNEAKELLQEIIAASAKIHGATNTNSTLVLAVANAGTESQLRKLLINPEIRLNADALIKNCEHMSNSGRIDMVLKLAKAGRGMGHAIKEQDLYNILLNNFVRENNCLAALELYEKLEADDGCKISQEFLKALVKLFKINQIEIPTNVALRAHNIK